MCQAGSVASMNAGGPGVPVRPTKNRRSLPVKVRHRSWVAGTNWPSAAADSGERADSLGIHVFAIVAQLRGRFMSNFDRAHWIRIC